MFFITGRLLALCRHHLYRFTWPALAMLAFFHAVLVWLLLYQAGELELTQDLSRYFYFYVVTISTVGYGDFSPQTVAGEWITALALIIPGLGLFGSLLGKLVTTLSHFTRRAMLGEQDFYHLKDHIIIFGWNPPRTRRIIELILGDKKRRNRRILLAVTDEIEHPFPDNNIVDFIRLESYTDEQQLARCAIQESSKIIIDSSRDDQTLTIALSTGSLLGKDSPCHISAYFEDQSKANLLTTHMPYVESSCNRAAEILTRSMQDPGSSRLYEQLLDTLQGTTQFSLDVPPSVNLPFGDLFHYFKTTLQVTLIGVATDRNSAALELNPALSREVQGGEVLYYIAQHRIHAEEVNWSALKDTDNS